MFKKVTGRKNTFSIVFLVLFGIVVLIALMLIFHSTFPRNDKRVIGCILIGSRNEPGWNEGNYRGLVEACADRNAELLLRENVPEEREACCRAIRSLAEDGCEMIFLTSLGYADFAAEIAGEYPDTVFYTGKAFGPADNMTYYSARMYQVRYLSGIVAGLTTRTGIVGYVAAMPNNEVNLDLNAFTLGVRSVAPDARVRVRFTGSWEDCEREKASVKALAADGADIIAYHQDGDNVPSACEELGIDYIGYNKLTKTDSEHLLTVISCRWQRVYGIILQDDLRGLSSYIKDYWLGLDDMTATVSYPSQRVDMNAVPIILDEKKRIESGRDVFSDIIYDNNGVLRCGEGELIPDRVLLTEMDWYVEGVEIIE